MSVGDRVAHRIQRAEHYRRAEEDADAEIFDTYDNETGGTQQQKWNTNVRQYLVEQPRQPLGQHCWNVEGKHVFAEVGAGNVVKKCIDAVDLKLGEDRLHPGANGIVKICAHAKERTTSDKKHFPWAAQDRANQPGRKYHDIR